MRLQSMAFITLTSQAKAWQFEIAVIDIETLIVF